MAVQKLTLVLGGALVLAILAIGALVYFYSPFTSNGIGLALKLGPGNCIDEISCRNYCEENLQECIEWCTENEHALCGAIAGEYLGGISDGLSIKGIPTGSDPGAFVLGPGGCLDVEDCIEYCETSLQQCIDWCGKNEDPLCDVLSEYYTIEST